MSTFNFENQIAFVTGTNKKNGIGRAIVDALLEQGVTKVYATARDASQLDELVQEQQGKVVAVELDVTDFEAIRKLPALYPDVTMVVNNAGYFSPSTSLTDDISIVQREMQVNYIAPLAIVSAFGEQLKTSESSTAVINIASIASLVNFPAGGTYSASKAAAHSLTQAQRRDLPNALVMGVYPGPIDTEMGAALEMDKAPPSAVAKAVMDALKNGQEDVFPDAMASQLFSGWKADAKFLEKEMAKSVVEQTA